jgi:hypothetical protein
VEIDRRTVLKGTLAGSALLGMGGLGLSLQPSALLHAPALKVLSAREYAILMAIAEVLIDVPEGLPSVQEARVVEGVDALMYALHPGTSGEFKQAVGLVENPVLGLLDGRFRPLSRLRPAARLKALEAWQYSALPLRRSAFRAIHGLLIATYWGDKRTHSHMGYLGPPKWLDAIRLQEAASAG